jgi:hypothetical protein
MINRFTEVTRTGYGKRMGRSLAGIIIGPILFISSFVLLFWNEGRQDLSLIAKTATTISAETQNADANLENKLVDTHGKLITTETLADTYLKPGNYISLKRTVEMYSWQEDKDDKSSTSVGGSETTETTYEYVQEWTDEPENSSDFKYPTDHQNPPMSLENKTINATVAKIGVYDLNLDSITMPEYTKLELNQDNTIINAGNKESLSNGYVYIGNGSFATPQIGDLRIAYEIVPSDIEVTVFGKLTGSEIVSFIDGKGSTLYRAFNGTRDEAIKAMHNEYVASIWMIRGVGFAMMWIGLSMFFGPLSTFLSFIPFLGKLSGAIIGLITFLVSLVLSFITVMISMLIH